MTNNGDLPASPLYDMPLDAKMAAGWLTGGLCGLTKREMFAMAAMQGLLSDRDIPYNSIAASAVKRADELLAELEKCNVR